MSARSCRTCATLGCGPSGLATERIGRANAATTPNRTINRDHFHCVYRIIRNMRRLLVPRASERTEELDEPLLEVQVHHLAKRGPHTVEVLRHRRLPSAHDPRFDRRAAAARLPPQ